jgi:hypothetical protein
MKLVTPIITAYCIVCQAEHCYMLENILYACDNIIYPMPEISDFQRTNSEFAKSEQKYPVKITLEYAH